MTSRIFTVLALVAVLALPSASALGEEVYATVDEVYAYSVGIAESAYTEVVDVLAGDTSGETEEAAAGEGEDADQHAHDGAQDDAPPAEEDAEEPTLLRPLRGLAPVPVVTDGPLPRIDLAYLDEQVQSLSPLAPAAPAAAPRAAAPLAPSSVEMAPAADAAPPAPVAPLAVAVTAAAATAASTGSAMAALWERVRRFGWLALLYSRIAKERLLDHASRERLLDAIRQKPGLAVADLAKETSLPRNTVTYHLRVLERERLASSTRNGRNRLFFAPGALPQRANADGFAALRHETTLAMARAIGANPGVDQKGLCERVGLSPSLAHWHADRLVASGLVDKRREGRYVRYYPGAAFGIVQARSA